MASIKEYNSKLATLRNTRKMTRTMKMVSASKLRRAQERQKSARAYAERLNALAGRLSVSIEPARHPLLTPREDPRKALIILFTSDKGLCGGFNHSLIRFVEKWMAEHRMHYDDLHLSFCGRQGFHYFRNKIPIDEYYEGLAARPSFTDAIRIGRELRAQFLEGKIDEIFLAYNTFQSALTQQPRLFRFLPMTPEQADSERAVEDEAYLFQPDRDALLDALLPRMLCFRFYYALLENAAGEHGARMTAMDHATGNCEKLVEEYTLLRNRARQAAITTELIEIISGADAL